MSGAMVSVMAVCEACGGGGYIGMGEKCGVAVVCFKCRGQRVLRMVHYERSSSVSPPRDGNGSARSSGILPWCWE